MQFSLGHHWRPFFCSCSNSGINLRAKLMDLNCSQEGRQKISVYQQGHGLQSRRNPAVQVDLLLHKIFLMDSSDLIIVVGFSASSKGFSVLFFSSSSSSSEQLPYGMQLCTSSRSYYAHKSLVAWWCINFFWWE
jgi:hypothetical protein